MDVTSRRARALATLAFLLLVVAVGTTCSKSPDHKTTVADMIAAHNRHDVAGQLAFFTEDAFFVIADEIPVTGRPALRDMFGADSVMNSELLYEGLVVRGDTVIVNSVIERNELLRLLDVPEMHYLPGTRVLFQDGMMRGIQTARLDQRDWRTMRDNFAALMNWLRTTHPELLNEIESGRLSGNNATAASGWLELAAEWRNSQAGRRH
ncbi:MAG: hypothetical protein JW952_03210 [Candidatus Eisenbacteria bacterium]|nr:hypothetical protein [Candidatus Eisenbacteria bacterium]